MNEVNIPAEKLLPHRQGMLLLDRAIAIDQEGVKAEATVKENNLFVSQGQMGAWVLVEYMAQAMAMWVSWNAIEQGKEPPVGFLLGTRKFALSTDFISVGEKITCCAQPIYVNPQDNLAQFDCQVFLGTQCIAQAKLNAFEPSDLSAFSLETLS